MATLLSHSEDCDMKVNARRYVGRTKNHNTFICHIILTGIPINTSPNSSECNQWPLTSFRGTRMRSGLCTHMHMSMLVHKQPSYLPAPYCLNLHFRPSHSLRWLDWSVLLRSYNFSGQWQVFFCVLSTTSGKWAAKRDREQTGYCLSVPDWHASHLPLLGGHRSKTVLRDLFWGNGCSSTFTSLLHRCPHPPVEAEKKVWINLVSFLLFLIINLFHPCLYQE